MKKRNIDNSFLNRDAATIRSLGLLETPHKTRSIALVFILIIFVIIGGLIFTPWQQSVIGSGRVIVMSPMDRPQNIESLIPARLIKWNVQEGDLVKADQTIAELADIDSKFLDESQVSRIKAQRTAQDAKLSAARRRAAALEQQIENVSRSRNIALPTAAVKNEQNQDKLRASEQTVTAGKQNLAATELNFARIKELHEKGLRSKRDLEIAELDYIRAKTELERSRAAFEVARRDQTIGDFDQQKVDADTSASLSALEASFASVQETIATIESDILKFDIELQNVSERRQQQIVRAPRSGQIVRLLKVGAGATVKAGDILAVLAPATKDQAVEIFLSDNDAPLVAPGRQVRLQFAGFPAIQLVGWPSVAVGTFAGRVSVIDAIDDGKNRYRVLITPDWDTIKVGKNEPWPSNQYLRPGSEATGWIMLDTVPLGFELWRQFNAFPPSIQQEPLGKRDDEKNLGGDIELKDVLKK